MTYRDSTQKFPLTFPVNWNRSLELYVVQDTTDELALPEHESWRAKLLKLPKALRAWK